ncbi:MAG: hypothetical protein ABIN97_20490 [Ginsengibacter sp.]
MRWFKIVRAGLLSIIFVNSYKASSQNFVSDTSAKTSLLKNAVNLYHKFLLPETGLYNGSEYTYKAYYPFVINEGHPFFISKQFVPGSVFYNNVLYENVPLLYDIVKEELIIKDLAGVYFIKLNNESIQWFIISGHTFIRLNMDNDKDQVLHTGFYDLLYNGNVVLYKKVLKLLEDRSAFAGIEKHVIESNKYFIKKDNRYYAIKNKKSLLPVMSNRKKEVQQFIRSNKLNFRKAEEDAIIRTVTFYDSINNTTIKAANQ